MKKNILITLLTVLFVISASGQKIGKPTLTPTEPTEKQQSLLLEGIKFHNEKQYDRAIQKYQQVLEENPDCALAIYELSLSYYNQKDFKNALETAYKLVKYKGKEGVLGYGIIGNILDDQGKPQEAVEIYESAIKQLKGVPEYRKNLAEIYFNLGVTLARQKKYTEARRELKNAVEANYQYASPHYLLSEVFYGTKYKIPAFAAASRFLTMEINTPRAKRAVAIILDILKPAQKDEKGNINIFLDFNAPKDEGDFGGIELFLGTLTAVKTDEDKNKTENEIFADAVSTLIALMEENKDVKSSFVGKKYISFLSEMKKKGYVKHFAYLVLQQNGNKEADEWLLNNGEKSIEFFEWAKSYNIK